ncbi:MAG: cyclic nucleotide-binding domain-containing protein [Nitrospinota bacterium]|nr:cyclic nucleotide-binding domain-containing protein [Nitrospinota bacterium]
MKTLHIRKGREIFEEGSTSDCAYIIESGSVEVTKNLGTGIKQVLGTLHEKGIFGELGLIDGLPRTATVTALEDCSISVLSPEVFNALSKRNPQALIPFLKILTKRLRDALRIVNELESQANK